MQSQISKIIITLIVLLLVVFGIAAWVVLHPQPPIGSLSTQTPSTGVSLNNQTTVTSSSGGQNQNQPQTRGTLDIGQAYTDLFQKLLAQQADFVPVGSSAGATGGIYTLYANDVAAAQKLDPTSTSFPIEVSTVDLNADGVSEAIVYEDLPGFCGSGGCMLDIYQKQNGKWIKIFSTLASGGEVGLANNSTNSWLDLFITVPGAVGSEPNVMRYVWSDTTYKAAKATAVWTGTQFQLLP